MPLLIQGYPSLKIVIHFRFQRDGLIVICDGLLVVGLTGINRAAQGKRLSVFGLQRQRLTGVTVGLIDLPQLQVRLTTQYISGDVIRQQFDRPIKINGGLGVIFLGQTGSGSVEVERPLATVQSHGLTEIANGLRVVAQMSVGLTTLVKGIDAAGSQPNRLVEIADCFGVIALPIVKHSAPIIKQRLIRL